MIEVFTVDLRQIKDVDFTKFCDERIEKIKRKKTPHSRLESIGAELALIKAVTHFYPDAKLPVSYKRNKHGKPYLSDYPLFIGISHSGDYAVCVVSDTEVGIDIQKIRTADLRIAKRHFTNEECEYIGNDELRFFELWSKKESYLKAIGTGLTVPLNSFSTLKNGKNYEFIALPPPSDEYVMQVCKLSE